MTIDFCRECLQEAIDNYGSPKIFNTDQGSQFTSPYFISIWKENNKTETQISMDGRGRATDNAFIERLWRSVKQEDVYPKKYEDGASLYIGLNDYFYFYNHERKHQGIDSVTPEQKYNADVEMLKVKTKPKASGDFQHSNIVNNNDDENQESNSPTTKPNFLSKFWDTLHINYHS